MSKGPTFGVVGWRGMRNLPLSPSKWNGCARDGGCEVLAFLTKALRKPGGADGLVRGRGVCTLWHRPSHTSECAFDLHRFSCRGRGRPHPQSCVSFSLETHDRGPFLRRSRRDRPTGCKTLSVERQKQEGRRRDRNQKPETSTARETDAPCNPALNVGRS
jgi:hypothetical protein